MQNTAARKMKQVPEGYLVVGIDPHKKTHAAVAIAQDVVQSESFSSGLNTTNFGSNLLLSSLLGQRLTRDIMPYTTAREGALTVCVRAPDTDPGKK